MVIRTVELKNFRNYEKESFVLGRRVVIVGENGAGKSNLLEALYLLMTGRSFRADADYEMIRKGENFARIEAEAGETRLTVILTDGSLGVTRKKFEVNGVGKRGVDFVGQVRGILFTPQDMDLITGSPSIRRKYLDFVISQKDREYRRNLISYEKGIRQRNKLLEAMGEGRANRSQLFFWDRLVIKNGEYLTFKREEYLGGLRSGEYRAIYDKSVISETRLKQYEVEEVAAKSTLVGPHRDDFEVEIKKAGQEEYMDVTKYGSRGEQRMAVFWLKRGERAYLGEEPVILLDDIFSELDMKHREEIVKLIEKYEGQVIMTTAELGAVAKLGDMTVIEI